MIYMIVLNVGLEERLRMELKNVVIIVIVLVALVVVGQQWQLNVKMIVFMMHF